MKVNRVNLFMTALLYRVSTIILMFSMILANDIYKDFSINDSYLIVLTVLMMVHLLIYSQVNINKEIVKASVYLETAVILFIYTITGGIFSPVIWLVINPLAFYMFYYKNEYYLVVSILLFVFSTLFGPYCVGKSLGMDVILYIPGLFLTIMMFVIVSVLSKQYTHNRKKRDELDLIREGLIDAYSLVGQLLVIEDEDQGVQELFNYIESKSISDGFFITKKKPNNTFYYSNNHVKEIVEGGDPNYLVKRHALEGDDDYGYFGLVYSKEFEGEVVNNSEQVELLVKLATLFFDRNQFRDSYVQLLIKEEQDRIAREMHDGVKQDIHGITYFLHNIIAESDQLEKEEIVDKIKMIYDVIGTTSRELRKTIYHLNDMSTSRHWTGQMNELCSRLQSQYNIQIEIDFKNDVQGCVLSLALIEALKRSLKEATANAVEHGKAKKELVSFSLDNDQIMISIVNDGLPLSYENQREGIGIQNMKKLAKIYRGSFSMKNEDRGVLIEMSVSHAR